MLIGIVEHNGLRLCACGRLQQPLAAFHAAFAYGNARGGKLLLHLQRFVAHFRARACLRGFNEAFRAPSVAAREHGGAQSLRCEQAQEVFRMRRLARAAHGEIAHADGRHAARRLLQYTLVEEHIAYAHNGGVNPREWQQQAEHRYFTVCSADRECVLAGRSGG